MSVASWLLDIWEVFWPDKASWSPFPGRCNNSTLWTPTNSTTESHQHSMITKAILLCLNLLQKWESLICQLSKSINLLQKDRNDKTEIVTQMTKPDRTKPKSWKETFVISISNRVGRWIWGSLGLAANNLQSWRETTFSPSSFKTGCWLGKHVILLFWHRFGQTGSHLYTDASAPFSY